MEQLNSEQLDRDLRERSPQEVMAWAAATFHDRVALASSFGAEDVVLIDMLARSSGDPSVFAIDTGRLPEATYEVMDRVRERYGIAIEVYYPQREAVERLEREAGFHSFRRSLEARHACCEIRKVEPLRRAPRAFLPKPQEASPSR
jgi:phosphoadenosine phosphosulfate reductase